MKKFSFLMLCIVLIFGACQKNLDVLSEEQTGLETNAKDILWMMKKVDRGITTKAVGLKDKFWNVGDTIRIKFLPGGSYNQQLEEAVKRYAQIWLDKTKADLFFEYVSPEDYADVKIGFDLDERWMSWSTIGTDCKTVPQDEPSLNFRWLDELSEDGFRGEILKGFGFVLGLVFEHQSPVCPIVFKSNAPALLMEEYNLSAEDVNTILTQYTIFETKADTFFDKTSIMTLPIPRIIIENPKTATVANTNLSIFDIEFIDSLYHPIENYGEILYMKVTNKRVSLKIQKKEDIEIDWGDGTSTTYGRKYDSVFLSAYVPSEWIEKYDIPSYLLPEFIEIYKYDHVYQDGKEVHEIRCYGSDRSVVYLDCNSNGITEYDFSKSKDLKYLACAGNKIPLLDVSQCHNLESLDCSECNSDADFDLRLNKSLKCLVCQSSPISKLNLQEAKELIFLFCMNSSLTSLDLSQNTALEYLDCNFSDLTSLDVRDNVNLKFLSCNSTGPSFSSSFSSLDVSQNPSLFYVEFVAQNIKTLDFTHNPLLEYLNCDNTLSLESLNISKNLLLKTLLCGDTKLRTLNITHNVNLRKFACPTLISYWDFSNNVALEEIGFNGSFFGNADTTALKEIVKTLPDRNGKTSGRIDYSYPRLDGVTAICSAKNWIFEKRDFFNIKRNYNYPQNLNFDNDMKSPVIYNKEKFYVKMQPRCRR